MSQRDGLWCSAPQVRQVRGGLAIFFVGFYQDDHCQCYCCDEDQVCAGHQNGSGYLSLTTQKVASTSTMLDGVSVITTFCAPR